LRGETAQSFGVVAGSFGQLLAQTQRDKADVMRWIFLTMLGSVALSMAGKFMLKFFGY
jgi:hypothetical protein